MVGCRRWEDEETIFEDVKTGSLYPLADFGAVDHWYSEACAARNKSHNIVTQ